MRNIEWGPAIRVNGVKPEWLKNDEWRDIVVILNWDEIQETDDSTIEGLDNWGWSCITSIRLPSSHAVYSVIAHNAEHGTKFTYWPGGVDSNAPSDWDGKTVLYRDGSKEWDAVDWAKYQGFDDPQCSDIIGYTKRVAEAPMPKVKIVNQTSGNNAVWVPKVGDRVRVVKEYGGGFPLGHETVITHDASGNLTIRDKDGDERLWEAWKDDFELVERAWTDPDDAPELTDEWFEKAELIPSLAQQVTEALAERDMLRHQVRELRAQLAKVKEILG